MSEEILTDLTKIIICPYKTTKIMWQKEENHQNSKLLWSNCIIIKENHQPAGQPNHITKRKIITRKIVEQIALSLKKIIPVLQWNQNCIIKKIITPKLRSKSYCSAKPYQKRKNYSLVLWANQENLVIIF